MECLPAEELVVYHAAAQTFVDRACEPNLLSTYQARLRRALEKDLAALKSLQSEQKAAHQKAVDQFAAFTKYAISRREDYDPDMISSPLPIGVGSNFQNRKSCASSIGISA
jgi:hypothetical protein